MGEPPFLNLNFSPLKHVPKDPISSGPSNFRTQLEVLCWSSGGVTSTPLKLEVKTGSDADPRRAESCLYYFQAALHIQTPHPTLLPQLCCQTLEFSCKICPVWGPSPLLPLLGPQQVLLCSPFTRNNEAW